MAPVRSAIPYSMRLALLLVLGGCAISHPVQPPVQGGIFVPESATGESAASAAERKACAPDGRYVGGLGEAICDVDQRRLQLLAMAAGLTNAQASYNAWLWPLGAAALYEKVRGAPTRNLLPAAALATGVFGYINSGHPGQAELYIQTAGKLTCLIVEQGADLYTKAEFHRPQDEDMPYTPAPAPGLEAALRNLRDEARAYARARDTLLAGLKPRAATTVSTPSTFVARAQERHGGARAGGGAKDPRADIRAKTQKRLDFALKILGDGRAVHTRIVSSGMRLRAAASQADSELQSALTAQASPPQSPASAAANIVAQMKLLIAQSGQTTTTNNTTNDADGSASALPATAFDGLSAESARELRQFQAAFAAPLQLAIQDVQGWIGRHAQTRVDAKQAATEMGCPVEPARTIPPAAGSGAGAQRPGTAATAASAPESGTLLPSTN